MKQILSMIFGWYVTITLLAFFGAHTLSFVQVFSGVLLSWLLALSFFIGYSLNQKLSITSQPFEYNLVITRIPLIYVALTSIAASIFLIYFYTGKSITEVFTGFLNGESLYYQYQQYFREQELEVFSVTKIPAILSGFMLKMTVLYTYIKVLVLDKKTIQNFTWLIIVTSSFALFSIARGTSIEIFEILLLIWFLVVMKLVVSGGSKIAKNSSRIIILTLAGFSLFIYTYNISARYSFNESDYCATRELCKNPDTLIYSLSPQLGDLTYALSGYFTFGIFYSSSYINSVWFTSWNNLFSGLIPYRYLIYGETNRSLVCDVVIDCGVAWQPDAMLFVQAFGVIGLFIFTFLLGRYAKKLYFSFVNEQNVLSIGLLFLIFLSMISLPVGNFLLSSSANVLAFMFMVFISGYLKVKEYTMRARVANVGVINDSLR
jgi:hypothetical protein